MDHAGRKTADDRRISRQRVTLVLMSQATSLWHWAILMPLYAWSTRCFGSAVTRWLADTVEPQRRAEVYALLRTGDNTGYTIGPALGGFLISVAYLLSYLLAAATQFVLAIFVSIIIRETLIRRAAAGDEPAPTSTGYGAMLRDRAFMSVWGLFILVSIASSLVFVLLGVYIKENYHVSENHFGFIIGTNAILVVIFQYTVTQRTQRFCAAEGHVPGRAGLRRRDGAVFDQPQLRGLPVRNGDLHHRGNADRATGTALVANIARRTCARAISGCIRCHSVSPPDRPGAGRLPQRPDRARRHVVRRDRHLPAGLRGIFQPVQALAFARPTGGCAATGPSRDDGSLKSPSPVILCALSTQLNEAAKTGRSKQRPYKS